MASCGLGNLLSDLTVSSARLLMSLRISRSIFFNCRSWEPAPRVAGVFRLAGAAAGFLRFVDAFFAAGRLAAGRFVAVRFFAGLLAFAMRAFRAESHTPGQGMPAAR